MIEEKPNLQKILEKLSSSINNAKTSLNKETKVVSYENASGFLIDNYMNEKISPKNEIFPGYGNYCDTEIDNHGKSKIIDKTK